jgi:hypothetical protein
MKKERFRFRFLSQDTLKKKILVRVFGSNFIGAAALYQLQALDTGKNDEAHFFRIC